jgi:hypothetical protein
MRRRAVPLCLLAIAALPREAGAHLMPEGNGSTRVVANRAYSLIAVPVSVLRGFDDDRNGRLSIAELTRHRRALQTQLEQRIRFFDGAFPGKPIYHDILIPHADSAPKVEATSVTVMRIDEWPVPVRTLRLQVDVFARSGVASTLAFRAIMGDSTEVAVLKRGAREHGFFGAALSESPARVAAMPAFAAAAVLALGVLVALRLVNRGGSPIAS